MELLTTQEVAAILKKSDKTVRRYVIKYGIPSYSGNRFKLDEFMEAIRIEPIKLKIETPSLKTEHQPLKSNNLKYRKLLGLD